MQFQPIVRTNRENDLNQLWIKHAVADIHDGGGNVVVSGRVTIQSLRSSKHRLWFQDLEIRGAITGDALPPEKLSQLHIYVIPKKTTKFIDAIMKDQDGMHVGCVRDYYYYVDQGGAIGKKGDSFQVPIPAYTDNACQVHVTKVFAVVIVLIHQNESMAVIASGEFLPARVSFRPKELDFISKNQKESIRKGFITAAAAYLPLDEPLDREVIAQYSSKSRSFMRSVGKSETGKVNFEAFKLGLDHMNVILLESRARALFDTCDVQDLGLLGTNEVETALMVNDALPSSTLITNVRDIFSCFDIDNRGRLSFRQFSECIGTPALKSGVKPMDDSFMLYLFRKYANPDDDSTIDFDSFARLWSRHIADAAYELERRGIQCQPMGKKTRMAEKAIPLLKSRRQKDLLYRHVISEVTDFKTARQRIIELRVGAKKESDEGRRKARNVARKQRRETVIAGSNRGKSHRLFLKNMMDATAQSENRRSGTTMNIKRTTTLTMETRRETIIRNRIEKDEKEQETIRNTLSDRLELIGCDLGEVPEHLYKNRESQAKLADLKILNFSRNAIKDLPKSNFFFHLIALRKVSLSMNKIKSLPEEIGSLKNLEILLLNQNEIEELPASLGKLEALQVLEVATNRLQMLPSDLCNLSALRVLSVYSNALSVLPTHVGNLGKLEFLDINNNQLRSLPDSIASLKNLVRLNVYSNQLLDLPLQFGDMARLEDLDLSFNMIQELPASISKLRLLKTINLEDNRLPWISDDIKGLNNIVTLSCERNCIASISPSIGQLRSAVHLTCAMNKIETIPNEIGLLGNLLHLDLQSNVLQSVPVEIGGLAKLQSLDLSQNLIKTIPHEFCFMRSLVYLDLSNNRLQCLPEHFGVFFNLSTLKVSNNQLTVLPESFKNLRNLVELSLASNNFKEIQSLLCDGLENLKVADFAHNRIQFLPVEIFSMPRLNELNLRHNDLRAIPLEYDPNSLNMNGLPLKLDITKNPLSKLPFKFSSKEDRRFVYENPSGYSGEEVLNWVEKEKFTYKTAVEEWTSNKYSYQNADLLFQNFHQGVIWRCENFGSFNENDISLLTGNAYTMRLKRFFFYCKKHGNPPIYVQLDDDETSRLDREYRHLQKKRDERSQEARCADLKRRADEHERYLGKFAERCEKASARFAKVEAERKKREHDQNRLVWDEVQRRVKLMEKLDEERQVSDALKAKREAAELNQLSFSTHYNKKRLLPLEVQPCWKKDINS